ncbi:MAG: queuosine precursor transporter [Planctomycetota bacterium]|nr:queuosine precursor transporter [Planctomycetota bacterium]
MTTATTVFGMKRQEAVYVALASLFVVVLVLTNIVGVKLFYLFPNGRPGWLGGGAALTLTAGIVTYPITFFLTDIVSEIWGRRRANFMVILGFAMSMVMLGVVMLAKWLPASHLWTNPDRGIEEAGEMQAAFEASFTYPGLLLFASMTAYLVAQLLDVRLYHFWWRVTKGRHMWIRNNGSTVISQLVDTIIVNGIFLRWGLEMEWRTIASIIVSVYVCKVVMAACDTPLIYLGREVLLRSFGLDRASAPTKAPLA